MPVSDHDKEVGKLLIQAGRENRLALISMRHRVTKAECTMLCIDLGKHAEGVGAYLPIAILLERDERESFEPLETIGKEKLN